MKVDIIDENKILVFLSNIFTHNMDFDNKEALEDNFKDIFIKLNNFYNIETYGYYEVHVYTNEYYGVILDISKETLEYIDYFDHQVDMRITFSKYKDFVYKIEDIFNIDKRILNKCDVYSYKSSMFLKINEELDNYQMGIMLENGTILYGKEADNIIRFGNIINIYTRNY